MIIDEMNKSISRMIALNNKSLSSDEINKKNADNKLFKDAVYILYVNTKKLEESKKELNFKLQSRETISKLVNIVDELNEVIASGEVDSELVKRVYKRSNDITQDLKNEWDIYYKRKETKANGELEVISGLIDDEIEIRKIHEQIYKAKDWGELMILENGVTRLQLFTNAMKKIEKVRANLELSPNIELFLKAVSNNMADVDSLSADVLSWIKDNKLSDKFAIEFKRK